MRFRESRMPPYMARAIAIIYQLGTISMFYKFGNDASSLKKFVPDKRERSFLSKITKKVYSQNVSYLQSLITSTTRLSHLNPHRKEKVFVQSSQMFFYFSNPTGTESIEKEMQKVLSEKVHFKFAEASAAAIVRLISNLLKGPSESDRDEYFIHQVLSSSGVLLELNCKICLQIISPKVRFSYLNPDPSELESFNDRPGNWSYFVGVFFGTTVINHPPIIKKLQNSAKDKDAYSIVEKQLMDFIEIETPIQYSVVFAKFKLLFLREYDQYKFKYLARHLSKEGFFDSIGGFFSKAASVVSNVVDTATSVYSTAMDVYQNTIKPIAQTLTPVLAPFLPGSVGTVLRMVAQNAAFSPGEDQINVKQVKYLKDNFRNYLTRDTKREQGVFYPDWQHIFDYLVVVKLTSNEGAPQNHTGVLINEDIILSQIPVSGQKLGKGPIKFQCSFFKQGAYQKEDWIEIDPLTRANGKYYYFKLKNKVKFSPWFQLDFKKDHASSPAFHEYLANRDIFMLSFKREAGSKRQLVVQASKILKSTDKHFIDAFEKFEGCMGSPIFYVDKKSQKNIIIGTCTQDSKESDIIKTIQKDLSNDKLQVAKSTFLEESAFRSTFLPPEEGKNENSSYNQDIAFKQLISKRNEQQILAKSESLRSQLENGQATKPSYLSLVGIFKIEGRSSSKYGVGVLIDNTTLLTLKKYVVNEGNGSVYFRKEKFEGKTLDFDIEDGQKFDKFAISSISINDTDFARIQFDSAGEASKLKIEYIKKQGLKYSQKVGGYFLEFNFTADSLGRITSVPVKWSYISSQEMERQKINSSSVSSTTQRLYFAYQKNRNATKDSLNEYVFGISNPDASKLNYFFEEMFTTDKLDEIKLIQNSSLTENEKIIFSDRRRPLYTEAQLKPYEPIGIIMHRQEPSFPLEFSGTGTLVEVTIKLGQKEHTLKDLYMITCAHNFIFQNNEKVYDLSGQKHKDAYLFQYGKTKRIESIDDFLQRFLNLSQQNVLKNFSKVITPPKYKLYLESSGESKKDETTYDIAIVKLAKQPRIRPKVYKLLLNKRYSQQQLKEWILKNMDNISLTGFPGTQYNWQSKLGIMYTESVSSHSGLIAQQKKAFVELFDRKFRHKLSSLGGNSGSAIVLNDTVIGIHTTGVPKKNSQYGLYNLATNVYDEEIHEQLNRFFTAEAKAQLQSK